MDKEITLAFSVLILTACVFTFTKVKPKPPSDFRDAMADDLRSQDFDTSIPTFENNAKTLPVPKAVAIGDKKSKNQSKTEQPFLFIHLHSKPFMEISPEKTKKNIELFFKGLDMNIISYQDNNVSRAIDIKFREPKGTIDKIRCAINRNKIVKQIKNFPEVKSMRDGNKKRPLNHRIIFKKPIYPTRINELFKQFGNELQIMNMYRNKNMIGSIWVDISIEDIDKPQSVAKDLLNRFQDKIFCAEVSRRIQTFSATTQ